MREVRALAPVWNTPALHVAENVGMRPVGSYEDDEVGEVLIYETVDLTPASVAIGLDQHPLIGLIRSASTSAASAVAVTTANSVGSGIVS